jgi:uncharacterized membrane protein YhaH (DUF805 family)
MDYFLEPIKKYAEFNGRAVRKEYWMYVLYYIIIYIVLAVVDGIIGISLLTTLFSLGLLLPSLALGTRRLHDTGRTGWWQLIGLIPLVGLVILIYFFVQASDDDNQYGAQPAS